MLWKQMAPFLKVFPSLEFFQQFKESNNFSIPQEDKNARVNPL